MAVIKAAIGGEAGRVCLEFRRSLRSTRNMLNTMATTAISRTSSMRQSLPTMRRTCLSYSRSIEPYADRRVYLHTVRGIGYRLDVWPPPHKT